MTLKTLKDIRVRKEFHDSKVLNDIVETKILKKEAINWIKTSRTNEGIHNDCSENKFYKLFDYSCMACSEGVGMCGTEIIENFIKHFFNITEEELK